MPYCKLCGEYVSAGIVLHSDCIKEAVEEVCTYRCKWAVICEDKQKLRDRHCPRCGVTKLTNLLKERTVQSEEIRLGCYDSDGNLEQSLRINPANLIIEKINGEKLTIYGGDTDGKQ